MLSASFSDFLIQTDRRLGPRNLGLRDSHRAAFELWLRPAPNLLEIQSPPPKIEMEKISRIVLQPTDLSLLRWPSDRWSATGRAFLHLVGFFSTSETQERRGWDSNPRGTFIPAGFQDRCLQPLGHPSKPYKSSTYRFRNFDAT
jgi:hypothetical protein